MSNLQIMKIKGCSLYIIQSRLSKIQIYINLISLSAPIYYSELPKWLILKIHQFGSPRLVRQCFLLSEKLLKKNSIMIVTFFNNNSFSMISNIWSAITLGWRARNLGQDLGSGPWVRNVGQDLGSGSSSFLIRNYYLISHLPFRIIIWKVLYIMIIVPLHWSSLLR